MPTPIAVPVRRNPPGRGWWRLALLMLWSLAGSVIGADRPPNLVLIVADDLGWTDLGCYGSTFHRTPNLDRLAADGMRFTSAYAACTVCSPTRASILTGQSPARLHLTDWIAGHRRPHAKLAIPDWTQALPREPQGLARLLAGAGYATGHVGKWHLGGTNNSPQDHGFTFSVGGTERGQPPSYVSPYRIPTLPDGPPGEFLTDREAAEACNFIRASRARPFFLYLAHHAVHQPLTGKVEVIRRYEREVRRGALQDNAVYAALLESLDDSVGRVRRELRELGLSDNTIVVFMSDNGGQLGPRRHPTTSNFPLRSGKGSPYDGGVRVPFIVAWPGVTPAESINPAPVISTDLFPTFLELAGVTLPPGRPVDGQSLVPLWRGGESRRRVPLVWHYPHYHPGGATPYSAIRDGDLKLIEYFEDNRFELFDLASDPGESLNLAATRPADARRLLEQLKTWRETVGAQLPTPNPDYRPDQDTFE